MIRVQRAARAVIHGPEILALIIRPDTRKALVAAAETGRQPVSEISTLLQDNFPGDTELIPLRQYAGLCVRAVLEEEGFEIAASGVRMTRDPVFRTGAIYRRVATGTERRLQRDDALERMLGALTDSQARRAADTLRRRFPSIFAAADQRED
jgi:hypothetical protein